jgi:sugar/nucleoside kinase (ribokinase family)
MVPALALPVVPAQPSDLAAADARFDVVGIGNALVDVIAPAEDHFLERHDLVKGAMTLIETERAVELYAALERAVEMSGGSAANTVVGVASLGGAT